MDIRQELSNLDPNNPGVWPWPFQAGLLAILFVVILYGGWYMDVSDQTGDLAQAEQKEQQLKNTFEVKQKKAANLNALKEQMKEMQQSFGDMLRQLPNKTEIASLIVDISQTTLQEFFTMIMMVDLGQSPLTFHELSEKLSQRGEKLGVKVELQREEIFKAMHRI